MKKEKILAVCSIIIWFFSCMGFIDFILHFVEGYAAATLGGIYSLVTVYIFNEIFMYMGTEEKRYY